MSTPSPLPLVANSRFRLSSTLNLFTYCTITLSAPAATHHNYFHGRFHRSHLTLISVSSPVSPTC